MIKSVNIKNIKGFISQKADLNNLTLFAGLNGMGKSTFIQSMLLLRQSYLSGRFPSKGGLLLNGDLTTIGIGKDLFAFDADSDEIAINIDFDNDTNLLSSFNYDASSDTLPVKNFNCITTLEDISLFNNNFQYLHAERLSPERDFFPGSLTNVKNGFLGKNGQFTAHYLAENQRKDIANETLKHPTAKTLTLLDNVDAWLGELSPGIKVRPQYTQQLNSSTLTYNFTKGDEISEDVKPANVGFGLTYILPVITALLIAKPDDIVIIENPESHIHPSGQSSIAKLCCLSALTGAQIVIETHSDHIINGVLLSIKRGFYKLDNSIPQNKVAMYFIERIENSFSSTIKPIVINEQGRIKNAPLNFFDQFAKDIKEMMNVNNESIHKQTS